MKHRHCSAAPPIRPSRLCLREQLEGKDWLCSREAPRELLWKCSSVGFTLLLRPPACHSWHPKEPDVERIQQSCNPSTHKAHRGAQKSVPLKHLIKTHGSYNLPPSNSHHSSAPGIVETSWGCRSARDVKPDQPQVNSALTKYPLCPAMALGSALLPPRWGALSSGIHLKQAQMPHVLLSSMELWKLLGESSTREKMRRLGLSWLTSAQVERKRTQSHFYLTVVLYLWSCTRTSD